MNYLTLFVAITMLLVGAGCSEESSSEVTNKPANDHIWKQQTRAMDRARDVESVIKGSAKRSLEEANRQAK